MAESTCVVEGCDKPRGYAAGWCPMHYRRMRVHGSLAKPEPAPKPPPLPCSIANCAASAQAKGLCKTHYKADYYRANRERLLSEQGTYREANREAYLARNRAYYERNRDRMLADMAERYRSNSTVIGQRVKRWRKANPIKVREYELRRRALKRQTQTEPVDYEAILAEHGMFCHICSMVIVDASDLHFDHLIPLSMGGAHTAENIKPAHALCNIRKGGRWAS